MQGTLPAVCRTLSFQRFSAAKATMPFVQGGSPKAQSRGCWMSEKSTRPLLFEVQVSRASMQSFSLLGARMPNPSVKGTSRKRAAPYVER
jgi:hypothetical protein